jgi:hypothetical protein
VGRTRTPKAPSGDILVAAKIRKKKSFGVRVLRKCLLTQAWDSCKKAKILKPTVAHHACFFKGMLRAGDLRNVETGRVRETLNRLPRVC